MILNEDNPSMKTDPECHKQSNQKAITLKVVRSVFYMFKKLSRPMEDIKKYSSQTLGDKYSSVSEMKNTLDWINKIKFCKRKVSAFEDIARETIQNETQKN